MTFVCALKMKAAFSLLLLPAALGAADALPAPADVTAAMRKAAIFYQEKLSVHGGYATEWKADFSMGMTEHKKSPTVISIQPHGTTTMGLALVKAYRATGEVVFLKAARAAAGALIECQLSSGGWDSDFDFAPDLVKKYHLRSDVLKGDAETGKRRNRSTLDDNKTQSALLFLLELAHLPESRDDAELHAALKAGLDALLAAQYPNGAWPQQFSGPADVSLPVKKAAYPQEWPREFPGVKYDAFYTLNDGNMEEIVKLLLRAHELTGKARFLASAEKAGGFFLLAQMPEPQPVWAQQYNFEMEPVWARKFEPPAVGCGEGVGVMRTLVDLWAVTGKEAYLQPLPAALKWFQANALPDGQYARFYELRTGRPLYFVKDTYELTYDDGNLPTHYGFKIELAKSLANVRSLMEKPREELLKGRAGPDSEKAWTSKAKGAAGKAARAVASLRPEGYWQSKEGGEIQARDFVEHFNAMTLYLEGAAKGGESFAKLLNNP